MQARNLTFFTVPALELGDLDERLREAALKPVGPMELQSWGFVPPLGREAEAFVHTVGGAHRVAVGTETRILPPAVVNDLLAKRLAAIEQAEGRKPGGRERKRLRDELITDLLPRALVQPGRVDAYLDATLGLLVVDTASRKQAEAVASELRRALGSFPALPLQPAQSVRVVLTGWLAGGPVPIGLELGDEAVLQDTDDGKVTLVNQQLHDSDEVREHLAAGKRCTRLGLVLNGDHVRCTVGEDLVIRKLRLLDGATDALANTERDTLRDELDARFALLVGEVGTLFSVLAQAFGIRHPDALAQSTAAGAAVQAARTLAAKLRADGITATISGPGLAPITFGGAA